CKDAFCYHLGSATSGTKYNDFKVRISARNNIYLIYKNMPTIQIAINIIPIALGTIVKQIFFINKGFGLDYFFGIFDAFKNIKHIERVDFNKVSPFRLFSIETELVVNLFKYIKNFLIRH
ncbi:MAG: glycosyltransferase family 2 protein, partial [Lachnospiraceae bacterium]|nr:glycosyltransferase family 2 protein [Lachnospiraceae bacterium]